MNQIGATKLSTLFFAIVFGVTVYFGFQVLPYFYNYFAIENEMAAQARKASINSPEKIRKYLLKKIRQMKIPMENESDLKLYFEGENVRIELDYTEYMYFEWDDEIYDLYEFNFEARANEKKDYSKSKVW